MSSSSKIIMITNAIVLMLALAAASCQVASAQVAGSKTAANMMAASADGVSRFLAGDGPIQPAITAIAGLPLRGAELINKGLIGRFSEGVGAGARSMARMAGTDDSDIFMPGMESLRQLVPGPISSMGSMMSQGISYKNRLIMDQAQRAIAAGERLSEMMSGRANGE